MQNLGSECWGKERGLKGIRDKDGERGELKGSEGGKGGVEGTRGRAKEVW